MKAPVKKVNTTKNKKCNIRHSKAKHICRIDSTELLRIMANKELTDGELKLLLYFYCKGDGWELDVKEAAEAIHVKPKMWHVLKKGLIKKEYLHIINGTVDSYYVGRTEARKWRKEEEVMKDDSTAVTNNRKMADLLSKTKSA